MRQVEAGYDQDIDVTSERDVTEWTEHWGITRAELNKLMLTVGAYAGAIAAELGFDAATQKPRQIH